MNEREALLDLEKRRCEAISTGDVEQLEALLTDDYVHVHMTAKVDDRAEYLRAIAKRPRTTTRGQLEVRIYGELAVLTGELTNQMPGAAAMKAYCHQVAVRQNGAWRFVSIQLTPFERAKP